MSNVYALGPSSYVGPTYERHPEGRSELIPGGPEYSKIHPFALKGATKYETITSRVPPRMSY